MILWHSFTFYKGKESVVDNIPGWDCWYFVLSLLLSVELIAGCLASSPGYPGLTFLLLELGYGNIITTVLAGITMALQGYAGFLGITSSLAFWNFNKARKAECDDGTDGETA